MSEHHEHKTDLRGASILLVDDTPANLDVLCALLEREGYDLALAQNGEMALKIARRIAPDLILLDGTMPGMDGFEVCRQLGLEEELRAIPVIFISARDRHEDIIAGFQIGGRDYITKPFSDREVLARVHTHLSLARLSNALQQQNRELAEKNRALEEEMTQRQRLKGQLSVLSEREAARWGLDGFVGLSPTVKRIFDEIRLLQDNPATSVLVEGESGTGKELIARAIHFGSPLKDGPFVPVNCAAMPSELAESLLFGHRKGAFTSANEDRPGYFETAHGGTLFLDELGEMPLDLQAKLLRVLEDGNVQRVGEQRQRQVDVRVVAATNADLQDRIRERSFRQDLYFRIARFTVYAPPLRERREDIPLLAQHFLQLFAAEMGRDAPEFDAAALHRLGEHDFPGNVRELKNVVERALLESRGGPVQARHLYFAGHSAPAPEFVEGQSELATLEENERRYIRAVLEKTNWVVRGARGAAAVLNLPESTLRGKIKKLGINQERDTAPGAASRA